MRAQRQHAPWSGTNSLRHGGARRNASLLVRPEYVIARESPLVDHEAQWGDAVEQLTRNLRILREGGRLVPGDDCLCADCRRYHWEDVRRQRRFTQLREAGMVDMKIGDTREIEVQYTKVCLTCEETIGVGEMAVWCKGVGLWHEECGAPPNLTTYIKEAKQRGD